MIPTLSYRLRRLNRVLRARLSLLRLESEPLLPTPAPLLRMEYRGRAGSDALIVFLPGIGDLAEDFERRGFIRELHRHHVTADAVAVDAHLGYYATRVLIERITEDVLAAAADAGYEEVWLVGVSLGGFGAAYYAAEHPGRVGGMLLMAPYLGEKALVQEIEAAGGVHRWQAGPGAAHDHARGVWQWFKQHLAQQDASEASPRIFLGYGTGDRFARANALLGAALPPSRVFAIAGGHDWRTWEKIWKLFLQHGPVGRLREREQ